MPTPTIPIALGLSGLLPFLAATYGGYVLPDFWKPVAFYAALMYGLAILSFLGGVHWGIALQTRSAARFVWSVVPSLAGFFAMFAPRPVAFGALAAAFAVAGIVDVMLFRRDGPQWFAALRLALTVVVVVCLSLVATLATEWRVDPFGVVVEAR